MVQGLLSCAYRRPSTFCALRSCVRHQGRLIEQRSRQVLHWHKAWTQMKVQLDNVLRDCVGKSGLVILRSIVGDERNPYVLAQYRNRRVKPSKAEGVCSLTGNWRAEHLHELVAGLRHFDLPRNRNSPLKQFIEQTAARWVPYRQNET